MSIVGHIKKLGLGAAAGALVGVALVFWINPTTYAGVGLIIVIATLVGVVFELLFRAILRRVR